MSVRQYALRRAVFRKRSGAVSNPHDGRMRSKWRRSAKRLAVREYLKAWDEALVVQSYHIPVDSLKEQTNG